MTLADTGLAGDPAVLDAVGNVLNDTATYTSVDDGAAMLSAATTAMSGAIPTTPAEQLTNFKALIRQVITKLAPNPTDETSFDRATLDTLIPGIADQLPAAKTTVRAIQPGQTKTFSPAEIETEALLMVHETTGISTSKVTLSGLPAGRRLRGRSPRMRTPTSTWWPPPPTAPPRPSSRTDPTANSAPAKPSLRPRATTSARSSSTTPS